jgi:transcriptional regulator with XRE-family HTH domain
MPSLREARLAAGLTMQALAARARVGASTVYRIEQGIGHPRPHVARRLAAALGLPPEEVRELRPVVEAVALPRPIVLPD